MGVLLLSARQFGWHFINVEADFADPRYCQEYNLWIGTTQCCQRQYDFDGTMTNLYGHMSWTQRFIEQL